MEGYIMQTIKNLSQLKKELQIGKRFIVVDHQKT